jgi:hypothetical protein
MIKRYQPSSALTPSPKKCTLAHDLNNSLCVILGGCDLLTELLVENGSATKHLALIHDAAQKIARCLAENSCQLTQLPPSLNLAWSAAKRKEEDTAI